MYNSYSFFILVQAIVFQIYLAGPRIPYIVKYKEDFRKLPFSLEEVENFFKEANVHIPEKLLYPFDERDIEIAIKILGEDFTPTDIKLQANFLTIDHARSEAARVSKSYGNLDDNWGPSSPLSYEAKQITYDYYPQINIKVSGLSYDCQHLIRPKHHYYTFKLVRKLIIKAVFKLFTFNYGDCNIVDTVWFIRSRSIRDFEVCAYFKTYSFDFILAGLVLLLSSYSKDAVERFILYRRMTYSFRLCGPKPLYTFWQDWGNTLATFANSFTRHTQYPPRTLDELVLLHYKRDRLAYAQARVRLIPSLFEIENQRAFPRICSAGFKPGDFSDYIDKIFAENKERSDKHRRVEKFIKKLVPYAKMYKHLDNKYWCTFTFKPVSVVLYYILKFFYKRCIVFYCPSTGYLRIDFSGVRIFFLRIRRACAKQIFLKYHESDNPFNENRFRSF